MSRFTEVGQMSTRLGPSDHFHTATNYGMCETYFYIALLKTTCDVKSLPLRVNENHGRSPYCFNELISLQWLGKDNLHDLTNKSL